MQFTELQRQLQHQQQQALAVARSAIACGLEQRKLTVNLADYEEALRLQASSFVTLKINGQLRGCIGALQATMPLIKDIAEHAYSAAFNDHRFKPLSREEFSQVAIHISVLTPQQKMKISDEQDLLAQLTPFEDGLTLEDGFYRATFLPAVWEQLPDKKEFLLQLKRKAGMADDYWSEQLSVYKYSTVSIVE